MLITSISGIRGTIGGIPGENLTPVDIVAFVSAYGTWLKKNQSHNKISVVIGRDGRGSGSMVINIAVQTLIALGIDVINLDYATTPTVEMMVLRHQSNGAIIITASHNPKEYNGLKLLNNHGEFLTAEHMQEIVTIANKKEYIYSEIESIGREISYTQHHQEHIEKICALDVVDVELVASKKFKICVDPINSVGAFAVPLLLEKLGVETVLINGDIHQEFEHKPEPIKTNLSQLRFEVTENNAHLGIAVDPDVDRLVFVDEQGKMFGEEYTLVSVADYVLSKKLGPTVSNISSSQALADVTHRYKQQHFGSAVGEKNVVEKMKEVQAVIGGEGSGGIIYPELHYGRDALVGIALFLTHLAHQNISMSDLRRKYPDYHMVKEKIILHDRKQIEKVLIKLQKEYATIEHSTIDGLRIDFNELWIHIRSSNTEPILRIIAEGKSESAAENLVATFIKKINDIL
jgi:phosphomannomutase